MARQHIHYSLKKEKECCLKYRFHEIETELSSLCLWTIHLCSRLLPAHFSIHPFWINIFHGKQYLDVHMHNVHAIIKWMKWKKRCKLAYEDFILPNIQPCIHAINVYDYVTVQPCMKCDDVNVLSLMWWKSYYAVQCTVCGLCIVHHTRKPSASLHRHHQLMQQPSENIAILLYCCCVGGGLTLSNYVILFRLIFRFDTKSRQKQSKIGGASNCGRNNPVETVTKSNITFRTFWWHFKWNQFQCSIFNEHILVRTIFPFNNNLFDIL